MKAYQLLGRLRYLTLMDPAVDNDGNAWTQDDLIRDAFEGNKWQHETVRERDALYKEIEKMGVYGKIKS